MKAEAAEWVRFADEDYAVGETLKGVYVRSAVWSYQQAAEKYLKALLAESGIDFPKTHDCVALLNLSPNPMDEAVFEACLRLAEYGPSRRYPGENLPITTQDGLLVFEAASCVREWCLRSLQSQIQT